MSKLAKAKPAKPKVADVCVWTPAQAAPVVSSRGMLRLLLALQY